MRKIACRKVKHSLSEPRASPANVGLTVRMLAQTKSDTTAIGDTSFASARFALITIVAILIGMLLPAVQSVR